MTKLKPCPFCGEKKDYVTEIRPEGYERRYEIVCWRCFCRTSDYGTYDQAVAKWNRRVHANEAGESVKCNEQK